MCLVREVTMSILKAALFVYYGFAMITNCEVAVVGRHLVGSMESIEGRYHYFITKYQRRYKGP